MRIANNIIWGKRTFSHSNSAQNILLCDDFATTFAIQELL